MALIMEAQLQFQANKCGGKSSDGPNVSTNASGFLVIIIPPILQPHSFIYHGRSLISTTDSVLQSKFLLSF